MIAVAVRYPTRTRFEERVPMASDLRRNYTDESLRLAQFEQSAATRNGVVAQFPSPAASPSPLPCGEAAGTFDSNGATK